MRNILLPYFKSNYVKATNLIQSDVKQNRTLTHIARVENGIQIELMIEVGESVQRINKRLCLLTIE